MVTRMNGQLDQTQIGRNKYAHLDVNVVFAAHLGNAIVGKMWYQCHSTSIS